MSKGQASFIVYSAMTSMIVYSAMTHMNFWVDDFLKIFVGHVSLWCLLYFLGTGWVPWNFFWYEYASACLVWISIFVSISICFIMFRHSFPWATFEIDYQIWFLNKSKRKVLILRYASLNSSCLCNEDMFYMLGMAGIQSKSASS